MKNDRNEIVIRDFSTACPVDGICIGGETGKWRLLQWQSSTDEGQLLFAYLDGAPPLTVPLNVEGHYAISLGLFSPPLMTTAIRAKLSGEEKFYSLNVVHPFQWIPIEPGSNLFEEHFWKIADLTGQGLQIESTPSGSGLAFVRLIPLNDQQISLYKNPRTVEWFWTMDGGQFTRNVDPPTRIITDELDARQGTDFTTFSWSIGCADVTNYPTQVGRMFDTRQEPTIRQVDTAISSNIARLNKVADPCEVVVRAARERGLHAFISQRPQFWSLEPPNDRFASDFWQQHRDQACKTADGRSLMQLSFVFPAVRKQLVDILCEVAASKPDGVHLLFNRGVPCTLYEQPVIDEFANEHGRDIRELDVLDPRVVQFRYRYITTFLAELRQALGPGIQIAVNCFATRALNDRFGLDVRHWACRGLVDHLMPGRWAWQPDDFEMDFFNDIAAAAQQCKLWYYAYNANVWYRGVLPHEHRQHALALVHAGATALAGWDARPDIAALNLGQVHELEIWDQLARPIAQTDVHTLDGIAIDSIGTPHYVA